MTYAIWNMVTGAVNTTAPTAALIEREHKHPMFKRGSEQVIVDIPDITVVNYRDYEPAAFFEGMTRYINAQQQRNAQ